MPPHSLGNGNTQNRPSKAENSSLLDRLPPQNLEAEQRVLAAVLLDNEVLHDVVPKLKIEDFYRETHQTIYRAVRDLYDQGKAIDTITLVDELERRGEFKGIGGDETLAEIMASVAHAANARYHADIVREKSVQRRLI